MPFAVTSIPTPHYFGHLSCITHDIAVTEQIQQGIEIVVRPPLTVFTSATKQKQEALPEICVGNASERTPVSRCLISENLQALLKTDGAGLSEEVHQCTYRSR
jgi:hypothetical protein